MTLIEFDFRFIAIMFNFAYKMLCEIDRASLNVPLSRLISIPLGEFNRLESSFYVALDFNVSVTEEQFTSKLDELEKTAREEYCSQVFNLESIGSITSEEDVDMDDELMG